MSSLRDVKDDLLKDWLYFRDEDFCSLVNSEDRKHIIKFDEISVYDILKLTHNYNWKLLP